MATGAPLIAILARAPRPGRCKTRLIPRLGPRGAAAVQRRLLARLIEAASRHAQVELWCTPHARDADFLRHRRQRALRLRRQRDGELGSRMLQVLNDGLQRHRRVLLIGSDALDLTADDFRTALAALDEAEVVLQPSNDGGYVLIGARRRLPAHALHGIGWSSGRELRQTITRLRRHGRIRELAARRDLDTPLDWRAAVRAGLQRGLPVAR